MFGNGGGDSLILALLAGIIAAHHALQLGEFADHSGDEIGLGEAGGAFGQIRIGADLGRQIARQRSDPLNLVGHRAEFLLEVDGLQLLGHGRQRRLAVIVPEEARIIEPGRQDAAIALGNRLAAIGRVYVRHHDEVRREIAGLRVAHGEVFLVGAHGELDDLARQGEEIRVHVAEDDDRPFGEAGHLFQQALVLDQLEPAFMTDHVRLLIDEKAPVLPRENDRALAFEQRLVLVEGGYFERTAPMHAVAFGLIAGCQAVDLEIDHLAIEDAEHALQRAYPAQLAAAPAHRLRPVEAAHDVRHHFGDDVRQRTPRHLADSDVEIALLRVAAHLGLIDGIEPRPAQETLDRLLRRADLRALALFLHISRFGRQPLDTDGQAARAGESRDPLEGHASLGQAAFDGSLQVSLGLRLHAGGYLFGKEFE